MGFYDRMRGYQGGIRVNKGILHNRKNGFEIWYNLLQDYAKLLINDHVGCTMINCGTKRRLPQTTKTSTFQLTKTWLRGRPLIIWGGGVVKNEKKNCLDPPQKKINVQSVSKKKKMFTEMRTMPPSK